MLGIEKLRLEPKHYYWGSFAVMNSLSIDHQAWFFEGTMPHNQFDTAIAYIAGGVLDFTIGLVISGIYTQITKKAPWYTYIKEAAMLLVLIGISLNNNFAYSLHFQDMNWFSGTQGMITFAYFPFIAGCWPLFAIIYAILAPHVAQQKKTAEVKAPTLAEQLQAIEDEKKINAAKAGLAQQKAGNRAKGIGSFIKGVREEIGIGEAEPKAPKEPKAKKPAPMSQPQPSPTPLPQPKQEAREVEISQILPIETVKVEGYNPRTKEIIYGGRAYWTRKYASEKWSIALGTLSRIEEKLGGTVILYVDNNTPSPAHFFAADSLALVQRAIKTGSGSPTITLLPGRVQEQPTWPTNEPTDEVEVEVETQELQAVP